MSQIFCLNTIDINIINAECTRVRGLLSSLVDDNSVHEVGSTAVDGLIGKQDIDFFVQIPQSDFKITRELLDKQFTRNQDQLSNDIYQGYIVESKLDVAIQLTVIDGVYDNFLEFRDKLRADKDLRNRYNLLKRNYNGQSMSAYREAKHQFIEQAIG